MIKKAMLLYERGIVKASKVSMYVGVIVIVFMVLVTVADVVMRRVFSAPIIGAHEIQQLSLLVVTFLTWGYCQVLRGHVDITVVTDHLPRRFMAVVEIVFNSLAVVVYGILTWRILLQSLHMKEVGVTTAELVLPEWPFLGIFGVIGVALFVLVLPTTIAQNVAELRKK